MIRFLFDCLLWGLGFERRDQDSSTGFDGEHLIPTRRRTATEAAIRVRHGAREIAGDPACGSSTPTWLTWSSEARPIWPMPRVNAACS